MATRKGASGTGSIRKKTVTRSGKEYTYWEARYTSGTDSGTGKQIQRTVTGKTQKEVSKRMKEALAAIDAGTYSAPTKTTISEWLDVWKNDYLGNVKQYTYRSYETQIENHIKPALGRIQLEKLTPHEIQSFYNQLQKGSEDKQALSGKTIKNVHGVLHRALKQAVLLGYIRANPADAVVLPRTPKTPIHPLDEEESKKFLLAIQGHRFEALYTITLFTGLREGEALGLLWDCVDFNNGTILIDKQLQREKKKNAQFVFVPLKNDKSRVISPAPWCMQILSRIKKEQEEQRNLAGSDWDDTGFVFADSAGHHLSNTVIYKDFKKVVAKIGRPDARFHDLRHSYATAAIRAGDDIKTVSENLGHATCAFTLDVYGHVTDQMKQVSAQRMEHYIKDVLDL